MTKKKPTPENAAERKDDAEANNMTGAQLAAASALPAGFKTAKILTLPVITIKKKGEGRVLTIKDAIRVSKVEGKVGADGVRQKPANICTAIDAVTGEMGTFLVPSVVQGNLEKEYAKVIFDKEGKAKGVEPGTEKYVGKTFHIVNLGKRSEGQRYNDFKIAEVTVG